MISVGCAGAPGPAATPATLAAPIPAVSTAAMDAHLKYLADDLLEGRAPATRGGRLAAKYIAAQFAALGLEPAGSDGSYFQPVALVGMTPHPSLVWGKGGATRSLAYLDDFVAWAERPESHIVAGAEVVFVGYGIEASEWQWDDYKGADVRGKVLLMLVNDPGLQDSTIFNGRALTYYGRWTYKLEEAARRGALGAILVHTPESATYGWDVVRGSWSVEQFKLDRPAPQSIAFAAWVTHDAAQAALARANLNLDSLTRAAARREFRPVATGINVAVDVTSALRHVRSENVLAKVPGATRDVDALGVDRSTLGAVFDAAARAESLTVVHEPDVRGSFYRSDHFPFSKVGVPALSIEPGRDFVGRPAGWGEQEATRYNRERYHQPGDEYRPTFTYAGMAQEVRVAMRVALAVANAPAMPRWLPNSEFQRPAGRAHP